MAKKYTEIWMAEKMSVARGTVSHYKKKLNITGRMGEEEYRKIYKAKFGELPPSEKKEISTKIDVVMKATNEHNKEARKTKNKLKVIKNDRFVDNKFDINVMKKNLVDAYNWNITMIEELKRELEEYYKNEKTTSVNHVNGTLGKHPNIQLIKEHEKEQRQIVKLIDELQMANDIIDTPEFSFTPKKGK